jgi:MYND finger
MCHQGGATQRCPSCGGAYYCSSVCRADATGSHKAACEAVRSLDLPPSHALYLLPRCAVVGNCQASCQTSQTGYSPIDLSPPCVFGCLSAQYVMYFL